MPRWLEYILWAAALLTAVTLIWTRVVRPVAKLITVTTEMLPLLNEFVQVFRDSPGTFKVLDDIAAQFKTDSGSSLRDVVDRLDLAAKENRIAAEFLKVGVETQKQLAEQDRATLQRTLVLLDRLGVKLETTSEITKGIVRDAESVAADLAESHKRADDAGNEHGAAADAAVKSQKENQ
jgi:hypothetical protein